MKKVEMRNGNILTLPTETETTRESGLIVQVDLRNYRELEVIAPDEKGTVKEGDILCVPLHVGTQYKDYIIIHRDHIIFVK